MTARQARLKFLYPERAVVLSGNMFYVLAGTMSVLVGTEWIEAATGSFVVVPGNVTHDFENRGAERAGVLNVSAPGNFEQHMPSIAQWFAEHPPGDTRR